jgi:hypothetical protein
VRKLNVICGDHQKLMCPVESVHVTFLGLPKDIQNRSYKECVFRDLFLRTSGRRESNYEIVACQFYHLHKSQSE